MVDIVALPTTPGPVRATPRLVSFATDMTGPLGGPTQRVLRLGSRFAVDFEYAPMRAADAQKLVNRLIRAEGSPVAISWPVRGYAVGPVGAVVAGAGASGYSIPVTGGAPGALIAEGRALSLSSAGRRWMHLVQNDVVLDGSGAGLLTVNPLLRVAVAAGDALEFVAPVMEGFVDAGNVTWSVELVSIQGLKITVTEDR